VDDKPFKTVFLSYRFADDVRFEVVQQIAVRLRFFSIEVVLDQRSLDYGEDIKEFMLREIRRVDAFVPVVTKDYNEAMAAASGPGEGVRFEVQAALQEKATRPAFQIIPLLLDGTRPAPPFDRMKCATPGAIDEVITQLGLASIGRESRMLRGRYKIDGLVEMRGMARIFHGRDMVADLPIEVYLVAVMGDNDAKYSCDLFERVVKGRSSAFSPFLLNIRDTQIDDQGNYFLITERFVGTDLGLPLARGQTTHPFGALCIAHQVCLALHELHGVGVIHGGLAPRCIRLNREQTSSKIVDFEFAVPAEFVTRTGGVFEGYPQIMPPERLGGAPVSIQQDIYQVANLVVRLVCGKPAVNEGWTLSPGRAQDENPIVVEDPRLEERLLEELLTAVERASAAWPVSNPWLEERVRETSSRTFLAESLVPLLMKCLAPDPDDRPRNCYEVIAALQEFGVPPVGHIVDRSGSLVPGGLFSLEGHEE
jgi:hypothetical protein